MTFANFNGVNGVFIECNAIDSGIIDVIYSFTDPQDDDAQYDDRDNDNDNDHSNTNSNKDSKNNKDNDSKNNKLSFLFIFYLINS